MKKWLNVIMQRLFPTCMGYVTTAVLNGGYLGRHGLPSVAMVHLECQEGRPHGSWDFVLELEHSQSNPVMTESVSHLEVFT